MITRTTWLDRAAIAFLSLVMVMTGMLIGPEPIGPGAANGYVWGKYKVVYKTANQFDCAMQHQVARRFTGPIQKYPVTGCKWRIRTRRTSAFIDSNGWTHRRIYLENSAPVWNAWGMSLTMEYKYKGNVLRVVEDPSPCRAWALFVTVKKEVCEFKINTDGIDTGRALMQYTVGWNYLFGNVAVDRGGKVKVGADGYFGAPVYWP